MRIDTLTIENFKSIKALQIDFGGGNAVISGQNGTGKTSVLDAVCWLLSNKMSDGKTGESANIHDTDKVTVVEIKFTDGLTLRRECNGKSVFFINNVPCNLTGYNYQTAAIFKAAVPVLLTPFNFCRLHYTERRGILLKLFAPKNKVDAAEFAGIADLLQTMTPEQIIKQATYELKQIEKESSTIPARIDELSQSFKQYDLAAIQTEIESLQTQISANAEVLKKLQLRPQNSNVQAALKLEQDALQLENRLADLRVQFRTNEIELARLRKLYSDTQVATTGVCPTCGNKVPAANIDQLKAKLAEIIAQGKNLAEQQELLKSGAAVSKTKITELRQQAAEINTQPEENSGIADELQAAFDARAVLQEKLSAAKFELVEAQRTAETQKRIEQLKAREVELGVSKSQCDRKIYLAIEFIRQQMARLEESVNQHFQFVQFKMFQPFKVAEGVKECCEPFMDGVPYLALSKGEQLKASLDILNALQTAYGVELPAFIDDAESYTSNSFVDLPNQIVLLKAIEGVRQLQIDIDKNFDEVKTA